jgi:hypothetical protein
MNTTTVSGSSGRPAASASPTLHTFILRIGEPDGAGTYPVELLHTPVGAPPVLLAADSFTATDLAALPLEVPGVADPVRDAKIAPTKGQPAETALFKLIFRGTVLKQWNALLKAHPRFKSPTGGRRIVLEVCTDELQAIMWERTHDPNGLPFPTRDVGNTLVRGPIGPDDPLPPLDGPLRVLVVIGSEEKDPRVRAEDELDELERTFCDLRRQLDCRVLIRPTRKRIEQCCRHFRPHVFHFIGHGRNGGATGVHLELVGEQPRSGARPTSTMTWRTPTPTFGSSF